MKKIFLLFAIFTITIVQSCKKDTTAASRPEVADIPLIAYDMKMSGDSAISYLPDSCILILKSDYTWTLDVNGVKCFGKYTWTPTVANTAQIKFTINQWTPFGTDPTISNKLKNILSTVDVCQFPGATIYQVAFFAQNFATNLRSLKQ